MHAIGFVVLISQKWPLGCVAEQHAEIIEGDAASTSAPSVEQDERAAFAQAAIRMLGGYAQSYEST